MLDITHSVTMLIEKGLDLAGHAAVAVADVFQFYDHICVAARPWRSRRCATSCRLGFGCFWALTAEVGRRKPGTLTGSRTAVELGRIPIADVMYASEPSVRKNAFRIADQDRLSICTHVDNLIAVTSRPEQAVASLRAIDHKLKARWNLQCKPQ